MHILRYIFLSQGSLNLCADDNVIAHDLRRQHKCDQPLAEANNP